MSYSYFPLWGYETRGEMLWVFHAWVRPMLQKDSRFHRFVSGILE